MADVFPGCGARYGTVAVLADRGHASHNSHASHVHPMQLEASCVAVGLAIVRRCTVWPVLAFAHSGEAHRTSGMTCAQARSELGETTSHHGNPW
jgi:hypothetical protein